MCSLDYSDTGKIYESVFSESISLFRETKESFSQYRIRRYWELFDVTDKEYHLYSYFLSIYKC